MNTGKSEEPRMMNLEYREAHPPSHGVTLGIEIEIPKEAVSLGEDVGWNKKQKKDDKIGKQLAKIWRVFVGKCETRFEEAGLLSPAELWKLNKNNKDEHTPFKQLGKILDKSEQNPESEESKFVHDIRLIVISTRAEIKEVMKSEK